MKQCNELLTVGLMESFRVLDKKTVGDLVRELNLEGKTFAILVNGRKVDEMYRISDTDEVIVLPIIAGGFQ